MDKYPVDNFNSLLSKSELVSKKNVTIWIVVTIILMGILLIDPIANAKVDLVFMRLSGIVTSILAGMLFAYLYQRKENGKLDVIRSVGRHDLIEEVLREVAHYQGVYCEDHSMDVRLMPHPSNNAYYLCAITHDYKKSRLRKELEFVFYRTTADSEANEILPEIADEALIREFVWYNDEKDFASSPNAGDYGVGALYVDGKPYTLKKRVQGNHLFYYCELPSAFDKLTRVRFDVTVPIEKESILSLTSEFPSKGVKVVFRWNDLAADAPALTVFPTIKLGLKTSPAQITHHPSSHEVTHHGWALPKDSCIFAWWNPK